MLWDMGKRLNALPEHVERVQTCRDGSSPVNQEIVTLGDGPPLDAIVYLEDLGKFRVILVYPNSYPGPISISLGGLAQSLSCP